MPNILLLTETLFLSLVWTIKYPYLGPYFIVSQDVLYSQSPRQ